MTISSYDRFLYAYFVEPGMKEQLREKMAGEIALSEEPGKTIRKWREQFKVSQQDLARPLCNKRLRGRQEEVPRHRNRQEDRRRAHRY
jgi:hypothetical protein